MKLPNYVGQENLPKKLSRWVLPFSDPPKKVINP